jgi:hypothetical protein
VVCICAVVLLILGSLSNVVGYQSVKSTTVNDSPLFQIRTQRATNQQQNSITSQYLGLGKENLLQFPFRDNETEQLRKANDIISKMDEKTFARFTELCIQRIRKDKSLKDTNPNDIIKALYLLKTKPVSDINSFINKNNQMFSASSLITVCYWYPGCILYIIMIMPLVIYLTLLLIYMENHPTTGPSCDCQP